MRLALFLLPACLGAADLTGIWMGQMPGRKDQLVEVSIQLKQSGSTLSGKQYGDYKSGKVVEGSVDGDAVVFIVAIPEQQGNQINEARVRYEGKIEGGELQLTRQRIASVDAVTGTKMDFKETPKVTLRLKKLF